MDEELDHHISPGSAPMSRTAWQVTIIIAATIVGIVLALAFLHWGGLLPIHNTQLPTI